MNSNSNSPVNFHSRILIKGGTVIESNSEKKITKDICIANKKIIAIGNENNISVDFTPDFEINAKNKIVCAGLVDCSAKLSESGEKYKMNIESELRAAVAGGVTSIVCAPDKNFSLDDTGAVKMLISKSVAFNKAHIYPLGALTEGLHGKKLTEMAKLSDEGCVGFTQANYPIADTQVLMRALQYASSFNYKVWLNPIDPWLGFDGVANSGSVSTRLGLSGTPNQSESISILTVLELIRDLDICIHFCRVSSERGVQIIRKAKEDGLKVSADVGIHHLHLTHFDIGDFNSNSKSIPPFRSERDREALTDGLLDGTIDCICSDHTPIDTELKNLPFDDAEPGLMGLELLLPLTLKWGIENKVSLQKTLSFITSKSSKIIGIKNTELEVGNRADILIFDEHQSWTVNSTNLVTKALNSPFYGYEIQGRVQQTIVGGLCVYRAED